VNSLKVEGKTDDWDGRGPEKLALRKKKKKKKKTPLYTPGLEKDSKNFWTKNPFRKRA